MTSHLNRLWFLDRWEMKFWRQFVCRLYDRFPILGNGYRGIEASIGFRLRAVCNC